MDLPLNLVLNRQIISDVCVLRSPEDANITWKLLLESAKHTDSQPAYRDLSLRLHSQP